MLLTTKWLHVFLKGGGIMAQVNKSAQEATNGVKKKEITVKVYFDSRETATKKGAHAIGCRN